MTQPAVSILLPVRNEANSLSVAITSIQRQTLGDWELVAINDGSTDQTGQLLDELADRDRRIKVCHLPLPGWPRR
jgi:glycosyltransferase involved in cell wall biosynthesis